MSAEGSQCCLKMPGWGGGERKELRRKSFEAESCLAPKRPYESKAAGTNRPVWDILEIHSSLLHLRI